MTFPPTLPPHLTCKSILSLLLPDLLSCPELYVVNAQTLSNDKQIRSA